MFALAKTAMTFGAVPERQPKSSELILANATWNSTTVVNLVQILFTGFV
jgi:hypothetical protein